jgi:hypothetical protein
LGALSYLVVEAIQDGVALVIVSPWLGLDWHGWLRSDDEGVIARVAVGVGALQALLNAERVPAVPLDLARVAECDLRERRLAVGDAFAAAVRFLPDADAADVGDPRDWVVGPVFDVSQDVRAADPDGHG